MWTSLPLSLHTLSYAEAGLKILGQFFPSSPLTFLLYQQKSSKHEGKKRSALSSLLSLMTEDRHLAPVMLMKMSLFSVKLSSLVRTQNHSLRSRCPIPPPSGLKTTRSPSFFFQSHPFFLYLLRPFRKKGEGNTSGSCFPLASDHSLFVQA